LPLLSGVGSVKLLGGGGADAFAGAVPLEFDGVGVLVFDDPPDEPPLFDDPSLFDEPSEVSASPLLLDEPLFEDEDDDPLLAHAPSESTNTPSRAMSARRTPLG
jgi:hypothetical protein